MFLRGSLINLITIKGGCGVFLNFLLKITSCACLLMLYKNSFSTVMPSYFVYLVLTVQIYKRYLLKIVLHKYVLYQPSVILSQVIIYPAETSAVLNTCTMRQIEVSLKLSKNIFMFNIYDYFFLCFLT